MPGHDKSLHVRYRRHLLSSRPRAYRPDDRRAGARGRRRHRRAGLARTAHRRRPARRGGRRRRLAAAVAAVQGCVLGRHHG